MNRLIWKGKENETTLEYLSRDNGWFIGLLLLAGVFGPAIYFGVPLLDSSNTWIILIPFVLLGILFIVRTATKKVIIDKESGKLISEEAYIYEKANDQ